MLCVEKKGIIYYTDRVVNTEISLKGDVTVKMKDLTTISFIVPILDRDYPLHYSILNEVHWYDKTASHCGVETTIRAAKTIAHILKVRQLVKLFRKNCRRY